jgi:hypothetical protein
MWVSRAGHVACIVGNRNVHGFGVGMPEAKRPFGRSTCKSE